MITLKVLMLALLAKIHTLIFHNKHLKFMEHAQYLAQVYLLI